MPNESYLPPSGQPKTRRRSWAVGVIGALVLGFAVYAGWWWFLADRLRTGIEDWRAQRIAEGVEVEWSSLSVDGFPGTVRASFTSPRIAIPDAWRWESDALALGLDPLDPTAIAVEAWGRHAIDVVRNGNAENVELTAVRFDGRVSRDADAQIVSFDMADAEVRRGGEVTGRIEDMTVTFRRFDPPSSSDPAALNPPAAFDLALDLTTEMTDPPPDWPFRERTQHARLDARVLGGLAVPLDRGRLSAWREVGGVLEIDRFSLELGSLILSGDGTVSVDRDLQPVGALSVRLRGFDKLVDALLMSGELNAKDAGIVKGILNLIAKIDPASGENVIDAGFTVQDRKLYLGPFELGEFPPVAWPE